MRETYNQRLVHQDQAFQETLTKFLQQSQPPFHTQQVPPIPPQQAQFYSDSKQHREIFEKESTKRKQTGAVAESIGNIPYPESDTSEYYDKSLSGIASKVPIRGKPEL